MTQDVKSTVLGPVSHPEVDSHVTSQKYVREGNIFLYKNAYTYLCTYTDMQAYKHT